MLLGLCNAENTSYSQLLVDKFLYMTPEDQARLRDCMRRQSLLLDFIELIENHAADDWFQKNAAVFLEVCDAHGQTAKQHHDQLVSRFIEKPSAGLAETHNGGRARRYSEQLQKDTQTAREHQIVTIVTCDQHRRWPAFEVGKVK